MNNSRQVKVNRADASSSYVTLFDKLRSGQVYNVQKVAANTVAPSGVNHMTLTSTQLPAGIIGIFGGTAATLPTNNSIIMANLTGAVGTGAVTTVADGFGNAINMVKLTDPATNEPISTPSNYATASLADRQVFGLLQAANGVTDGTAVGAVANCQISFIVFDGSNTMQLVNLSQTVEFDTTVFRDELHTPLIIRHGANQIDDAQVGGKIDYIERRFEVTTAITVGSTINVNTGVVTGTGATTVTTVVDGGVPVTNVNIQTSGASFVGSPSLEIWDNGVPMRKGTTPLAAPNEIIWESATTISCYRTLDIGDEIIIKLPLKNNA